MDVGGHGDAAGWTILGFGPGEARHVSVHETIHHRLDRTTSFGALLVTARALAAAGVTDGHISSALRDLCRTVHEGAAGYVTGLILPGAPTTAHHSRPTSAFRDLVAATPSDWTRFHGALAIARACMQIDLLPLLQTLPAAGLSPAHLDRHRRPDVRFAALRRARPDFGSAALRAARSCGLGADDPRMRSAGLDGDWFSTDRTDTWSAFSEAMYDAARSALLAAGYPTLGSEEHPAVVEGLLRWAEDAGVDVGVLPVTHRDSADNVWVAAAALDEEAFVPDPLLPAALGRLEDVPGPAGHIHIAIRHPDAYLEHEWIGHPATGPVTLRQVLDTRHGMVVHHTPVESLALIGNGEPVIVTIAESALRRADVAPWWSALRHDAVLLADTPLVDRLRLWVADAPRRLVRYVLTEVEAAGRKLPVLVLQLHLADGTRGANPMVRPLTHQGVGTFTALVKETGIGFVHDPGLLGSHPHLELALWHIVSSEPRYGVRRR